MPRGRGAGWQAEEAANWMELEDEAARAVKAQGGGLFMSGVYDCPAELEELAEW